MRYLLTQATQLRPVGPTTTKKPHLAGAACESLGRMGQPVRADFKSTLVTAAEHRGEGLDLLLATTLLAGLLVVALGANTLDDVLAIELLLHAAKRTVNGLVFADFDLDRHVDRKWLSAKKT